MQYAASHNRDWLGVYRLRSSGQSRSGTGHTVRTLCTLTSKPAWLELRRFLSTRLPKATMRTTYFATEIVNLHRKPCSLRSHCCWLSALFTSRLSVSAESLYRPDSRKYTLPQVRMRVGQSHYRYSEPDRFIADHGYHENGSSSQWNLPAPYIVGNKISSTLLVIP